MVVFAEAREFLLDADIEVRPPAAIESVARSNASCVLGKAAGVDEVKEGRTVEVRPKCHERVVRAGRHVQQVPVIEAVAEGVAVILCEDVAERAAFVGGTEHGELGPVVAPPVRLVGRPPGKAVLDVVVRLGQSRIVEV